MSTPMPESSHSSPTYRYPTTLIDIWRNKRGEQFVLRPVLPQDRPLLGDFFTSLSPRSRRLRFHGGVKSLSQAALRYMTEVDHDSHLALVVTVVAEGVETIVADARYVVDETRRGGEFAIAVSDVWQRRGIAERAMAGLRKAARQQGLDWLWGEVMEDNTAMLGLMKRTGFYQSALALDGIVRVERSVTSQQRDEPRARRGLPALLTQWLFAGRSYA
jgi:GNAT superfamily N-acetyltransferase